REILEVIRRESAKRGYPPSVREIGEALGLRSPSTVHGHLVRLARKGYIRRDPSKRRAIEVLRTPDEGKGAARGGRGGGADGARPSAHGTPLPPMDGAVSRGPSRWIPLVGRVTAGQPILA